MPGLNKEKLKWVVVIALVVIAIFILSSFSSGKSDFLSLLTQNKEKVGYGEVLLMLSNSSSICVVEDVTNTKDPIRKNIMDCGVNFASTIPLTGRAFYIYIIEGRSCYSPEKVSPLEDCLTEIKQKKCFVIFVGSKEKYRIDSYSYLLVVPVGKTLREGECEVVPVGEGNLNISSLNTSTFEENRVQNVS